MDSSQIDDRIANQSSFIKKINFKASFFTFKTSLDFT